MGSIPGSILGALLLGVVESLCSVYIAVSYRDVYAFLVLIGVQLIMPLRFVWPPGAACMTVLQRNALVAFFLLAAAIPLFFQIYRLRVCATALYFGMRKARHRAEYKGTI
jgi:hypothetical protein